MYNILSKAIDFKADNFHSIKLKPQRCFDKYHFKTSHSLCASSNLSLRLAGESAECFSH